MIVGGSYLAKLNSIDIQSVRVYKTAAGTPEPWSQLLGYEGTNGLIDITLKKAVRLPSQRLAQLGHRLRAKHATYLLNGIPVTDTRLRVATAAIREVTLAYTPTGPVLNVRVSSLTDVPLTPHPPGTIMIRGAAAYQSVR